MNVIQQPCSIPVSPGLKCPKKYSDYVNCFKNTIEYIKIGGSPHLWALSKLEEYRVQFLRLIKKYDKLHYENNKLFQENNKLRKQMNQFTNALQKAPTKLIVYNLHKNVTYNDIYELFSYIGPLSYTKLTTYKSNTENCSKQMAEVSFIKSKHTFEAIREYKDKYLDDELLKMDIVYFMRQRKPTL